MASQPIVRVPAFSMRPLVALVSVLLLTFAFAVVSEPRVAHAADYPGQAEIAAARAAVANAESTVADIDAAIVKLAKAVHEADVAARLADELFSEAQAVSIEAQRQLFAAQQRADQADASLAAARGDLAGVAMATYRDGGTYGQLEAIVTANGFADVIARSEALTRASQEADSTVQQVRAAELVASTMRAYAQIAAEEAAAAQEAARVALEAAQQARADAEQALADEKETREAAIDRLAELQRTTAALERERQAGLAAERRERERDALEGAQKEADNDQEDSGGSSDPSPPSGGGSWKSSASQGQKAVDHALSLMGSPYQSGGNGPGYDCSGLTKASWGAAGFTIPRTSGTQYAGTTHVSFSSLRKGDLIFWGSNRNASKIYHVAMYIGNGKVAEASTHGVPAKTRTYDNWAVSDIMPYAGRP
jgi:cell wall-associated NlpC family hydrolase